MIGKLGRLTTSLVAGSAKNLVARQSIFDNIGEGRLAA
jgi:hypothetical protein